MTPESPITKVKVRIRFRPCDDLPAGEFLWATPIDANGGGGTYELANCATFPWLAAGDVVRAELDGESRLQVTDVLEPADGILTAVRFHDAGLAEEAGDAWRGHGALWSEGGMGIMKTIWETGVGWNRIERAVAPYLARGLVWLGGATADERTRDHHPDVDFGLERLPSARVSTTYWVADDPYWREVGLDDVGFLAHVQSLASEEPTIAAALERGDHAFVLGYLGVEKD